MAYTGKWTRAEKWTVAGVAVAIVAIIFSLFFPEVRRLLGLEKVENPSATAPAQKVSWGPDNGYPPGILIVSPHKEFIPWDKLERELSARVLRNVEQIPAGSTLRVNGSLGVNDEVVEVISPTGEVVAHVWLGGDPDNHFVLDGLIRVGPVRSPVVVYATFERHVDGSYFRVAPSH